MLQMYPTLMKSRHSLMYIRSLSRRLNPARAVQSYPSVTKILSVIDKSGLKEWAVSMSMSQMKKELLAGPLPPTALKRVSGTHGNSPVAHTTNSGPSQTQEMEAVGWGHGTDAFGLDDIALAQAAAVHAVSDTSHAPLAEEPQVDTSVGSAPLAPATSSVQSGGTATESTTLPEVYQSTNYEIELDSDWVDRAADRAKQLPDSIRDNAASLGIAAHGVIDRIIQGDPAVATESDALAFAAKEDDRIRAAAGGTSGAAQTRVVPSLPRRKGVQNCVKSFFRWRAGTGARLVPAGDSAVWSRSFGYGGYLDCIVLGGGSGAQDASHGGVLEVPGLGARLISAPPVDVLEIKCTTSIHDSYALQLSAYGHALRELLVLELATVLQERSMSGSGSGSASDGQDWSGVATCLHDAIQGKDPDASHGSDQDASVNTVSVLGLLSTALQNIAPEADVSRLQVATSIPVEFLRSGIGMEARLLRAHSAQIAPVRAMGVGWDAEAQDKGRRTLVGRTRKVLRSLLGIEGEEEGGNGVGIPRVPIWSGMQGNESSGDMKALEIRVPSAIGGRVIRLDRGGGAAEDVRVEDAGKALDGFKAAALLGRVLGITEPSDSKTRGTGGPRLVSRHSVG